MKNNLIAALGGGAVFILCFLLGANNIVTASLTLIAMFVVGLACEAKEEGKAEKKRSEEKFDEFYTECQQYHITSLKNLRSVEKKQRVKLLGDKYGVDITSPEVIEQFNAISAKKRQEKEKEREKEKAKARQEEQAQYAKLIRYAQLHGNDKPVTMFKDLARSITSGSVSYIPMKKESDGAIMAGIASGIGGTVPALMSLSNTASNNEIIRQQNQAAQSINSLLFEADMKARARAEKYQEKADELAVKLVGDMPSTEVFQYLKFKNIKTKVSQFGTVTVKARASVTEKVTVFRKPGFIDGYVRAEIYDEDRRIGEARMVFPAHGSLHYELSYTHGGYPRGIITDQRSVELEGICLNCGEKGKEYTVKFAPGDLWIMEQ